MVLTVSASALAWTDPLTPGARAGRMIYQRGAGEEMDPIEAQSQESDVWLPATLFRCAQCHGARGEGSQEGGLRVPPLTPAVLRSSDSGPGRRRRPYTDETLLRAITEGRDASGNRLQPAMPRYRMTTAQSTALLAYMRELGGDADVDPGIASDSITVGAALPRSGPLAQIGRDVSATLAGLFASMNDRGGIYGRRVIFVTEDSQGEPNGTVEATRLLVERDKVFALVGNFSPSGDERTGAFLQQQQVPLIGPLALSPKISDPPNPYVFYSLPGFALQFRVLIDLLAGRASELVGSAQPRVAVIHAQASVNDETHQSALAQAARHGLTVVLNEGYPIGRLAVQPLVTQIKVQRVDAILWIGEGEDLLVLARALARERIFPILFGAVGMVGGRVAQLPPEFRSKVYLATGLPPPTAKDIARLAALTGQDTLASVGYARMAQIAGVAFLEALKRAGRDLSRLALIGSLETFANQDEGAGIPLSFGPGRRLGHDRVLVLGFSDDPPMAVPYSDWTAPKSRP